jgi:hypothetical protein
LSLKITEPTPVPLTAPAFGKPPPTTGVDTSVPAFKESKPPAPLGVIVTPSLMRMFREANKANMALVSQPKLCVMVISPASLPLEPVVITTFPEASALCRAATLTT